MININTYTAVVEVILYYMCSLFIWIKMLNKNYYKTRIIISVFGFVPLFLALTSNNQNLTFIAIGVYILTPVSKF